MTNYKIHISAFSLAAVLGLPDDAPAAALRCARVLVLDDVANWIEARVASGLIPELDSAEIDEGGAVNVDWDQDLEGISIPTDELDEEGLLRLRKRLVQAIGDCFIHHGREVVRQPSLDDIEAIAI